MNIDFGRVWGKRRIRLKNFWSKKSMEGKVETSEEPSKSIEQFMARFEIIFQMPLSLHQDCKSTWEAFNVVQQQFLEFYLKKRVSCRTGTNDRTLNV